MGLLALEGWFSLVRCLFVVGFFGSFGCLLVLVVCWFTTFFGCCWCVVFFLFALGWFNVSYGNVGLVWFWFGSVWLAKKDA